MRRATPSSIPTGATATTRLRHARRAASRGGAVALRREEGHARRPRGLRRRQQRARSSTPCSATRRGTSRSAVGAARYLTNGASDSRALDELLAEARKDATLKAARVSFGAAGRRTSHGIIVWKPASTASGRRVYKLEPSHVIAVPELSPWAIQDFTVLWRQGAEAARAADGDGAPGQGLAHEGPARRTSRIARRTASAAALATRARSGAGTVTGLAEVFACDVCGSAMRAPVVESHAGKVVEGSGGGQGRPRARGPKLRADALLPQIRRAVRRRRGRGRVRGPRSRPRPDGRGLANRTANFDAATLDRFKARSERIIYEQCLGDAVAESNRGSTLQQAGNHHSQTPHARRLLR